MRRSSMVTLTILPVLAAAAVAAEAEPAVAEPAMEEPPGLDDPALAPPGMVEPMLAPPGMTPTTDECRADPGDPRCEPAFRRVEVIGGDRWIVRGGFGHYFWHAGG